jgi:hypothetical protein
LDKAETFQFRDLVLEVAATTRLTVQITKMNLFLLGTVECVVDQALKTHRPSDFPHQPQFETVDLSAALYAFVSRVVGHIVKFILLE